MKQRIRWIDYTAYLALRLVATCMALFPIETNLRLMSALGAVWFHLPRALPQTRFPRWMLSIGWLRWLARVEAGLNKLLLKFCEHRNRAEEHIRRAFPDWDNARVERTALASMQQIAMLAVEVLLAPRLITQWNWSRYVKLGDLSGAIRMLLARRGCIMLTGHYGNWELLGYTLATLGFDIDAVMRPLDNEYINAFLLDRRERSGLRLLYKKGVTRSAQEVLENNGTLCFIADQNAGSKGLFVDFFGRKASTYKSIGLLAISHRAPIIVGCARRRRPQKFEYEIHVERIIQPEEWEGQPDELTWITQTFSTAMENMIRLAPEQYLWIHRRWKSRPKDEQVTANGL